MDLAFMALALQKGDFNFYDHDVIQANILSHAQLVSQGTKESEGEVVLPRLGLVKLS
jgi:hypothetical protein